MNLNILVEIQIKKSRFQLQNSHFLMKRTSFDYLVKNINTQMIVFKSILFSRRFRKSQFHHQDNNTNDKQVLIYNDTEFKYYINTTYAYITYTLLIHYITYTLLM